MSSGHQTLPRLPHSPEAERALLGGIWPPGANHSTSKFEKSERARRRNELDNRLLAEFTSIVVSYCEVAKFDDVQRKEFFDNFLGFLYDK